MVVGARFRVIFVLTLVLLYFCISLLSAITTSFAVDNFEQTGRELLFFSAIVFFVFVSVISAMLFNVFRVAALKKISKEQYNEIFGYKLTQEIWMVVWVILIPLSMRVFLGLVYLPYGMFSLFMLGVIFSFLGRRILAGLVLSTGDFGDSVS